MLSSRTHPHKPSDRALSRVRRMLLALTAVAAVLAGPAAGIAAATKPVNNLAPEIVGRALIGERLGCGAGSWTGGELSFAFRWIRAGIPVREGVSYTLSAADEHKQVWCVVTATRGGESTEVESSNSYTLGGPGNEPPKEAPSPIPPPPEVSGKAEVGATLSCSQGAWSGKPEAFTYRWLRNKEPISEAIKSTYTLSGADEGRSLTCKVTAENTAGAATAESSNSIKLSGKPPKARELPKVSGTDEVGQPLTCANPETNWDGSRPLTFKYRWLRNGTAIGKEASGSTYVPEAADEGQPVQCEVTASNSEGSAAATSQPVEIRLKPPENTRQPEVKGSATEEGATLECAKGTWTGSPTFEYEWLRESGLREPGQVSPLSKGNTYKVPLGERGYTLYCSVRATNSGGSRSRQSGPFVIAESGGSPPVARSRPQVSGSFEFGQKLTCSAGGWENEPTTYTYQWVRDAGAGEVSLELGTTSSYKVVSEDEGHSLSCRVTAVNGFGKATEESERHKIKGGKPVPTAPAPELSGNARVGESITCLHGGWSGAPRPTYSYQWLRNHVEIKGASGLAYTIVGADRGGSLTCVVTAENSEGIGTAETSELYVPGSPPEASAPPTVKGESALGSTLTCVNHEWSGAPAPTFTYQWLLNGVAIPSETASEYTIVAADRGLAVSCSVMGSSREGTAVATSKGLRVPGLRPEEVSAPQVSGSAALGATLTCNRGFWKGAPPPTFTYQWLRDGAAIASATDSTYIVEPADQGHLLSCNVTAANLEGRVEVESGNGLAIPMRLITGGGVGGFKATGSAIFQPSAAVVLADLSRELISAERGLSLKSVLKHGGFTFSFTAPTAGTLELFWYAPVKLAHGSSKKAKPLLVGRTSMVFTAAVKHTVHLKLTTKGRQALKGKKRVKLAVKGVFTVAHGKPVTWTSTLMLSR